MKERPILFSGPLVRALLSGTKTQTRRPAKGVDFRGAGGKDGADWNDPSCWGWADEYGDEWALTAAPDVRAIRCPYGEPGDRLWVRETWSVHCRFDIISPSELQPEARDGALVWYAADQQPNYTGKGGRWRPSIHMPRWASRLTLEITDVRVQRLHDITPEDAIAEGVIFARCDCSKDHGPRCAYDAYDAVQAFAAKWREIYGDASWDASPWVWALTFKVVKA